MFYLATLLFFNFSLQKNANVMLKSVEGAALYWNSPTFYNLFQELQKNKKRILIQEETICPTSPQPKHLWLLSLVRFNKICSLVGVSRYAGLFRSSTAAGFSCFFSGAFT